MMAFSLFLTFWAIASNIAGQSPASPVPERTPPLERLRAFLALPFDPSHKLEIKISEGDKYSPEEKAIHGHDFHYAVDFDAPQGEQLYAPCEGWAVQGFHTAIARNDKGPIFYKDKVVGFGLGHFVQILCKDSGVYVMLAHMQEVADYIPSVEVKQDQKTLEYSPDGIYKQLQDKTKSIYVKRGKFIGRVGHSGLGWGEFEVPFIWTEVSWDSFHAHIEVYRRTEKGTKDPNARWDPFGWYTEVSKAPYNQLKQSPLGLWLTDKKGQIKYACKNC